MSLKTLQFPSAQTIVSAAVSAAASAMLLRSIAREYLPQGFQYQIYFRLRKLFSSFSSQVVIVIDEFEGLGYNRLFNSVEAYLRPHKASDTKRFRVTKAKKEKNVSVIMERNEEIMDNFSGVQFKWKLISTRIPPTYIQNPGSKSFRHDYIEKSELRHYELYFNRKHKDMVFAEYLPYVIEKGKEVKQEQKTMKLFTLRKSRFHSNHGGMWESVNLDHPSTFDTLAMDLEAKQAIMEDLDRFLERKNFYRKVGKAWKRGYLLFGPPGTGKSSLIAAMANYLKFDVYDLELTSVRRNSDLRKLMISTGNRSILVVEDIDCSIELQDRLSKPKASVPSNPFDDQNSKLTLSALLNFIDGLWSSCGDERIIVFTTNHKDRLDPALLRPGRMDMHIHMSYCTLGGFRRLAHNYLGITQHLLFDGVEKLLKTTNVTPAEIAEELLKNEDSEIALRSLMEFLIHKKGGARRSHELCDDNDIQS